MSALSKEGFPYPLRDCASWCETNDRHADLRPDDRSCWSEYNVVRLSQHDPLDMGRGVFWQSFLNVYLRWRPKDVAPVVYVHSEQSDEEIVLTITEARELAATVTALADLADNSLGAHSPVPADATR